MPRYNIVIGDGLHIAVTAPSSTYTTAVIAETGLTTTAPAGSVEVFGPAMAYPGVVKLNAKLANGKRASFLCRADKVSTAISGLVGKACSGSTIQGVRVPRRRVLV